MNIDGKPMIIKPLTWEKESLPFGDYYEAETLTGWLGVHYEYGRWRWANSFYSRPQDEEDYFMECESGDCDGLEDGKAKAEAAYHLHLMKAFE